MSTSVMRHNGYTAGIRYSEEDGCLVGRILGIHDRVNFHGDSVKDMRREFAIALKSYLSDCAEMGKIPERPYSGKLMVRVTPETHRAISFEAESTGRSINDVIAAALQKTYLDNGGEGGGRSVRRKKRAAIAREPAGAGK